MHPTVTPPRCCRHSAHGREWPGGPHTLTLCSRAPAEGTASVLPAPTCCASSSPSSGRLRPCQSSLIAHSAQPLHDPTVNTTVSWGSLNAPCFAARPLPSKTRRHSCQGPTEPRVPEKLKQGVVSSGAHGKNAGILDYYLQGQRSKVGGDK